MSKRKEKQKKILCLAKEVGVPVVEEVGDHVDVHPELGVGLALRKRQKRIVPAYALPDIKKNEKKRTKNRKRKSRRRSETRQSCRRCVARQREKKRHVCTCAYRVH